MFNAPVADIADAAGLAIPSELVPLRNLSEPTDKFPVLRWGNNTYWPLSYRDNRLSIGLTVSDPEGYILAIHELKGARYVAGIRVGDQSLAIVGQDDRVTESVALDSLIPPPRIIENLTGADAFPPVIAGFNAGPIRVNGTYIPNGPCLTLGGYKYWPMSFKDNRFAFVVITTDINNVVVDHQKVEGARYIDRIEHRTGAIAFIGQAGAEGVLSQDLFRHSYTCCWEPVAEDFLEVATMLNVPLKLEDAQELARRSMKMTADHCKHMHPDREPHPIVKRDGISMLVGALVGGVVFAAIGFAVADGPGVAAGFFAGFTTGADIGQHIRRDPPQRPPPAIDQERLLTYVYYGAFPQGPFKNNGIKEDLFKLGWLPGYASGLDAAASLVSANASDPRRIVGYYPSKNPHVPADLDHANCHAITYAYEGWEHFELPVWSFLWVIVQIKGVKDSNGAQAYQLRFHPEELLLHLGDRPNHSYLTEGYRMLALVGYEDMVCHGAGRFSVDGKGRIIMVDSQTGHYWRGFEGNDAKNIETFLGFLKKKGYATEAIEIGHKLMK